jgi:hypothetical protein
MSATLASISSGDQPSPSPTFNLPFDRRSIVLSRRAKVTGLWYGISSTLVPNRILLVHAAANVSVSSGSRLYLYGFGQRTVGSHGIWCLRLHRPKEPLYCPQAVVPKGVRFLSHDLDRFRRCHRTDVGYRHSDLHARVL